MPPPTPDIKGQTYGRLTVLELSHRTALGYPYWRCRCACGKEVIVSANNLRTGNTKSCGCKIAENAAQLNFVHGHSGTPTYIVWTNMNRRCRNPQGKDRRTYKGVKICARWRKFSNFFADMGEKPKGKSLDRFPDPAGDYKPSNCRWATSLEQRHNRRTDRHVVGTT